MTKIIETFKKAEWPSVEDNFIFILYSLSVTILIGIYISWWLFPIVFALVMLYQHAAWNQGFIRGLWHSYEIRTGQHDEDLP